jgi:hypothetical protein
VITGMNVRRLHLCFVLILAIGFITGCTNNEDDGREIVQGSDIDLTKVKTTSPADQSISNKVKNKLIKRDDVTGVRGVNTDKKLFIALKITQFDRLHLKKIEKEVKDKLKKDYPDMEHEVSTDKKIYLELDELEKKLQEETLSKKKLKKEMKRIKGKMNDQA